MPKADKEKTDRILMQIKKFQEKVKMIEDRLDDPGLSEEEIAELQEALAAFYAKLEKLGIVTE